MHGHHIRHGDLRESAAEKVENFQGEVPSPKQYAEIVAYLRKKEGAS